MQALRQLVFEIVNPITRKHLSSLVASFGTVWVVRSGPVEGPTSAQKPCFNYSPQQQSIARLVLSLKLLPLRSLIASINDTLRDSVVAKQSSKPPPSPNPGEKPDFSVEIALLELLHECVRQVTVGELRESWDALSCLLLESPLGMLPARASFLEFVILVEFVRRCGASSLVGDGAGGSGGGEMGGGFKLRSLHGTLIFKI